MRRLSSPLAVVVLRAAMNAVMAAMLAGFVAARLGGSMVRGRGIRRVCRLGLLACPTGLAGQAPAAAPVEHGLRLPRWPAVAVLLAATGALLWLGLPFGIRVPMLAAVPFTAAVLMEVTARTRG